LAFFVGIEQQLSVLHHDLIVVIVSRSKPCFAHGERDCSGIVRCEGAWRNSAGLSVAIQCHNNLSKLYALISIDAPSLPIVDQTKPSIIELQTVPYANAHPSVMKLVTKTLLDKFYAAGYVPK
jgi:hypothetical protein